MPLRSGELLVGRQDWIEELKGNPGMKGRLILTNLRLAWYSLIKSQTKVSIGFDCIVDTNIDTRETKLRGTRQALRINARAGDYHFSFIFASLIPGKIELFNALSDVHRSYQTTKMYREVRLRASIFENQNLRLLPQEQLYDVVRGVLNLTSEGGSLGTMYISNVRIVWHCNANTNFNFSIPFLQIVDIRMVAKEKGLSTLLVETGPKGGNYTVGFTIDPIEKLKCTAKALSCVHKVFANAPIFGVEFTPLDDQFWTDRNDKSVEDMEELKGERQVKEEEEDEDEDSLLENDDSINDSIAAYYASKGSSTGRQPVYCPELGLAIEELKDGFTIDSLWQVLPPASKGKPRHGGVGEA